MNMYGVKSVFYSSTDCEERIVLYSATSASEALVQAEKDAREYAGKNMRMLEMLDAFELFDAGDIPSCMNRKEVYSKVLAIADLPNEETVARVHFGMGTESEKSPPTPSPSK